MLPVIGCGMLRRCTGRPVRTNTPKGRISLHSNQRGCCCVILGEEHLPSPQVSTLILRRTSRNWGRETS